MEVTTQEIVDMVNGATREAVTQERREILGELYARLMHALGVENETLASVIQLIEARSRRMEANGRDGKDRT